MAEGGVLLVAFFAGAIPFSNLIAQRVKGIDLRDTPYGTVSGTSIYRVAGFWPLAISGILDMAKGALGPLLAGDRWLLAVIAGGLAVVGHNWSPFLRGLGGRGVAPALGALAVTAWPGVPLLLGSLVLGKAIRETGLGGFFGEVALVPVLAITNGTHGAVAGAVVAVPMLVKRMFANSRPAEPGAAPYVRRLLFDRDPSTPTP
ncbi:MAG: glycerol-3-phosphate acyltransferase [Acidimicrobiia bacterium]|nr:glycerol-3-phosphate acyltransferase [Acidimicrobiia bacterium]